jgi:dihydroorotate dehydrogenase (fumarate)
MTVNLDTTYLGLKLKSPIVASACPTNSSLPTLRRLEEAGCGAAVLPSLFEEQIEYEEAAFGSLHESGANSFAEAASYFPELDSYNTGPDDYLRLVELSVRQVSMPIIGSLNGVTSGGWTRYAKKIEEAGAAALELNMYYLPTDPDIDATQVEANYLELVNEVSSSISIPLAVKIGPFFSAPANFAKKLVAAGANGLVLFNRFMQPDINLDTMQVDPQLVLSTSAEMRLPLRWIAILHGRVNASLAATSGIHTASDVMKLLLAGADVTMLAAVLLKHGPQYVATLLEQLRALLGEHGYTAVSQLKGSMSHKHCPNPAEFERSNYMKALTSYSSDLI